MNDLSYIENKEEFAQNLRCIRKCRGLTHQEMADRLRVNRSTYTYYELGRIEPKMMMIIELSKILNVDVIDLITKNGGLRAGLEM